MASPAPLRRHFRDIVLPHATTAFCKVIVKDSLLKFLFVSFQVARLRCANDDWTVMPNTFRPFYDSWIAHRSKFKLKRNTPLFCVLSKSIGNPIYRQYVWTRMQQLGKKLFGENESCHPHMLRRTCATRRLRKGYDLTPVASFLRHKTTASTHHYLILANKEDLAKKAADEW